MPLTWIIINHMQAKTAKKGAIPDPKGADKDVKAMPLMKTLGPNSSARCGVRDLCEFGTTISHFERSLHPICFVFPCFP